MATPSLLQASLPHFPALQEGVEPAVPLARRLQHAVRGSMEQTTADSPLAQTGVQDGLSTQSATSAAHPRCLWECKSQEEVAAAVCRRGGEKIQVFPL